MSVPFLILSLLIVGISAEVGRRLGRPRDREMAGLVWGILLGPLGWIVILSSPDLRHPIDRGWRPCPACGREIRLETEACFHCGAAVGPVSREEAWEAEFDRLSEGSAAEADP